MIEIEYAGEYECLRRELIEGRQPMNKIDMIMKEKMVLLKNINLQLLKI